MSRDVPYDPDEICDECGSKGAYDFMGDNICPECFRTHYNPLDSVRLLAEWLAIEDGKTRMEGTEYTEKAQELADYLQVIGYRRG